VLRRLRRRDDGFGLIELLIAMTMLNVGILALVAAFNSAAVALHRADRISTAAVLADKQMELLRAIRFEALALDATLLTSTDVDYAADAPSGTVSTTSCDPVPDYCHPSRPITPDESPNGRTYRLDTYIVEGADDDVRFVRVVVRDGEDTSRVYARAESTFHSSTAS
jgi:type II secretory pathway pseudopilin PulG